MADTSERDKLIEAYFYKGYTYRTITEFLNAKHGISISVRHLKKNNTAFRIEEMQFSYKEKVTCCC